MGGGGTSGTAAYPGYMSTMHNTWITAMNSLMASVGNPYSGLVAYDPSSQISSMTDAVGSYNAAVGAAPSSVFHSVWVTGYNSVLGQYPVGSIIASWVNPTPDPNIINGWVTPTPAAEAEISADVAAQGAIQSSYLTNTVLPRFKTGMRDINAVHSSIFTLGIADIEASNLRDLAKYQGDLRTRAFLQKDQILAQDLAEKNRLRASGITQENEILAQNQLEKNKAVVDAERQKRELTYVSADRIAANNLAWHAAVLEGYKAVMTGKLAVYESSANWYIEKMKLDNAIDADFARWPFEMYRNAGNLLGSIAGSAVHQGSDSTMSSVLAGAAAGAKLGSVWGAPGAITGGVIGAIGGWLSG